MITVFLGKKRIMKNEDIIFVRNAESTVGSIKTTPCCDQIIFQYRLSFLLFCAFRRAFLLIKRISCAFYALPNKKFEKPSYICTQILIGAEPIKISCIAATYYHFHLVVLF